MPSLRYHLNYYHHYEARGAGGSSGRAPDNARTDSGISPYVVESLPTFSFSALKGMKDGLECAVCLSRYDNADVLRLLPTCKHAFHLACIDLWLLHHSTCPLCRRRVDNDNENDHDLGSISISLKTSYHATNYGAAAATRTRIRHGFLRPRRGNIGARFLRWVGNQQEFPHHPVSPRLGAGSGFRPNIHHWSPVTRLGRWNRM